VAGKLGNGEIYLGLLLRINDDTIKALQRDNKGTYHDLVYSILVTWNNAQQNRTRSEMEKELCAAFSELGRNDIVTFIRSGEYESNIYLLV